MLFCIGRRHIKRSWILLVCIGFSSLAVSVQRMALLESHEMFWLVVAAAFLLRQRYGAAGAAYGVALLVKANALFLVPALLAVLIAAGGPLLLRFCLAAFPVAAGGYAIDYALGPQHFLTRLHFELGDHFMATLGGGVLVHFGRFGIAPIPAALAIVKFVRTDPVLIPLAFCGLMILLRHRKVSNTADRFFALWLLGGLAFHLGQVYFPSRYLTTLAPAVAWLATRWFEAFMDRSRLLRLAVISVLAGFCILHIVHIAVGISQNVNADYWAAVRWTSRNVPGSARILVSPYIGTSLPQYSLDFYYLLFPFAGPARSVEEVVNQHRVTIIVDDPEWRAYSTPDMKEFLARRCGRLRDIGKYTIWQIQESESVRPAGAADQIEQSNGAIPASLR